MRKTPALVGVALVVLGVSGCNSGAAEYQLGPAARAATAEARGGAGELPPSAVPPSEAEPVDLAAGEGTSQEAIAGATPSTGAPAGTSYLGRPASSWVEQLESSWDASQRMTAVSVLMEIGPGAEGVTSALIEALGDRNPTVREAATNALQRFGSRASGDLRQTLYGHRTHSVRAGAAQALGPLATADPEVLDSLIRAVSDRSSLVRRVSAEVLGEAGPAASTAVPTLTEALLDEDPDVRASAATALGRIGPAADNAIPALTVASLDAVSRVAEAARLALSNIDRRD